MDIAGFRERLATIAGEERFWQIVASLNHTGRWKRRFLYWQEILLAEADVVAPSPAELFDLVEPCLRVCRLHRAELHADLDGWAGRCRGAVTDFSKAQDRLFPNTDCGPIRPGDRFDNIRRGVWCCLICRAVEASWKEQHDWYC